ncbi:hypothetical protein F0562_035350 [Nyssa sinensis]|uniref:Uncharacterized protein n=1 Tax=Nyssa sinensis TaxID=561372 RepID=A0A5J5AEY9_9ASTE|nr:hypothetical protein F0562_035350 [Nyssa sinensis]
MLRVTNDEVLISRGEGYHGDGRGSTDDVQFREINGRKGVYRRTANDDFMIGGRGNQSGFASLSDPMAVNGFEHATNNLDRSLSRDMADESFIVPFRSMSLDQVGTDDRTIVDMDSGLPSILKKSENKSNRIGSQVLGGDAAASVDNRNKEVVTDVKQGTKKSEKDKRSKAIPDASDKRKTVGPIRKGKPSKTSPLDDARARAERIRTFKADLQKMKKEKEEEELKRLEALKMERQKRIAARVGSTSAQSPLPSLQTRKQMLTKVSPSSHKGSKFSDSEPGVLSPLQRSKIRATSLGSRDSQKASKARKLNNDSHLMGNRSSRSGLITV